MTERFRVTVQPSKTHPDILTVQDAMSQVLDVFDLLGACGEKQDVIWRLVEARTNSPFFAEGEAVSPEPGVDVTVVARAQKAEFEVGLKEMTEGQVPVHWRAPVAVGIATRIMERNLNGIGKTVIEVTPGTPPITVTPDIAQLAVTASATVTVALPEAVLMHEDREREEWGSLEGRLVSVGDDYHQPAICVEEANTGRKINCRVPPEVRERIANETNFIDVWENRRVRVRGRIKYSRTGEISRMFASDVERLATRTMTLEDIHVPDFAGGLSAREYLNRLRDDDLGT